MKLRSQETRRRSSGWLRDGAGQPLSRLDANTGPRLPVVIARAFIVASCTMVGLAILVRTHDRAQFSQAMCLLGGTAFALALWSRLLARRQWLSAWFPLFSLAAAVVLMSAGVITSAVGGGALWPLGEEPTFMILCLICATPWIARGLEWLAPEPKAPSAAVPREDEGPMAPGEVASAECAAIPGIEGRSADLPESQRALGLPLIAAQIVVLASCAFLAVSMLLIAQTDRQLRETMCGFGGTGLAVGLWAVPFARRGRLCAWFPLFFLVAGAFLTIAGVGTAALWGAPVWPLDLGQTLVVLSLILLTPWASEMFSWLTTVEKRAETSGSAARRS